MQEILNYSNQPRVLVNNSEFQRMQQAAINYFKVSKYQFNQVSITCFSCRLCEPKQPEYLLL